MFFFVVSEKGKKSVVLLTIIHNELADICEVSFHVWHNLIDLNNIFTTFDPKWKCDPMGEFFRLSMKDVFVFVSFIFTLFREIFPKRIQISRPIFKTIWPSPLRLCFLAASFRMLLCQWLQILFVVSVAFGVFACERRLFIYLLWCHKKCCHIYFSFLSVCWFISVFVENMNTLYQQPAVSIKFFIFNI